MFFFTAYQFFFFFFSFSIEQLCADFPHNPRDPGHRRIGLRVPDAVPHTHAHTCGRNRVLPPFVCHNSANNISKDPVGP